MNCERAEKNSYGKFMQKNLSSKWRKAFSEYERISGFEPMFQDEIDAGDITPQKAWCENLKFLENIVSEVVSCQHS
ncbi:MAG: hypothetical protein LRY40_01550 [Shewanella fodinae]|nr:hypothetical protein [Shewanella fodinae]